MTAYSDEWWAEVRSLLTDLKVYVKYKTIYLPEQQRRQLCVHWSSSTGKVRMHYHDGEYGRCQNEYVKLSEEPTPVEIANVIRLYYARWLESLS